ncbi:hypothetical protein EW146_g8388 [Bondarzewia mesenterica]|uniref:Fungal-type protein kinase domain-containing protein n=1 Tax=Bondarzewia mesenterica TaxID=1095465 RepID=A0A4S4LFE8_9AGAM|nr:hypothetical protein EW146_g8388 [Bondarzewia mesenterica]
MSYTTPPKSAPLPKAPQFVLPNTPRVKRSHSQYASQQHSSFHTLVGEVDAQLRAQLHGAIYIDTPGFLEQIFPVDATLIDDIFTACCSPYPGSPQYDETRECWTAFPDVESENFAEKALYAPFVNVANFVTAVSGENLDHPPVLWSSHPHHPPSSWTDHAADMKPDIVASLGIPRDERPPWRFIHVPMEVKKSSSPTAALLQILQYQRQIFHESHDRRFIIGITLAKTNISVYIADRSGILGSDKFDLHQDPKSLIRLIAGIQTLPLSRLGWDPTMRLVSSAVFEENLTPSRQWSFMVKDYDPKATNYYWIVDMPKPRDDDRMKMSDTAVETFVLASWVSISRGATILGRGTRVWKAWKKDEMHLPKNKRTIHIFKDTWRDERRSLEGEMYALIGEQEGVAKMHSYGIVKVDGEDDTTFTLIRRQLRPAGLPRHVDIYQKRVTPSIESPLGDLSVQIKYVIDEDFLPPIESEDDYPPRNKIHSRLVLATYGWSVKRFLSCLELVQALKDAITGHRNSYRQGILHRDVSLGNVLITGKKEPGNRGVLIDYDNSIEYKTHETIEDDALSGTEPFISPEILGKEHMSCVPYDLDDEPKHDAVHDLESFFWVLLYLSFVRSGPCIRREELISAPLPVKTRLQRSFVRLFEAPNRDVLIISKQKVFDVDRVLKKDILPLISPFCSPLTCLISEFHGILHEAYKSYSFEGIHDKVIAAFERAELSLVHQPLDDGYNDLRKEEEERRKVDGVGSWDVNSPRKDRVLAPATVESQADSPTSSWAPRFNGQVPDEPPSPTPKPKRAKHSR